MYINLNKYVNAIHFDHLAHMLWCLGQGICGFILAAQKW